MDSEQSGMAGAPSDGVVWAAFGERSAIEAQASARSVKEFSDIETCVVASSHVEGFDRTILVDFVRDPKHGPATKVLAARKSPYQRALFLDSDTRACCDVSEMLGILDVYDVALTRAHTMRADPVVPDWFHRRSAGMLVMRRNEITETFVHDWWVTYWEIDVWSNQVSLRRALYRAVQRGLKLLDLPREYECKLPDIQVLRGPVRMIHSGHVRGYTFDMDSMCAQVNNVRHATRVYVPGVGVFRYLEGEWVRV